MVEETTILTELEQEGFVVTSIKGTSMWPLLHTGSSLVLITQLDGCPQKGDVVLYTRSDGELILHRIIGFDGNTCLIRGDNTFELERVNLDNIKGVMKTVWHGNCQLEISNPLYRLYVLFWNFIYPIRWLGNKFIQFIKKAVRRILGDYALAWIVKITKHYLIGILLLAIVAGISSALSVWSALIMRSTIDSAVALNFNTFIYNIGLYLGIVVAGIVLDAMLRQADEAIISSLENKIKVHIYNNILNSQFDDLCAFHTGELQTRINSDARIVANNAVELIPDIMATVVQLILALIVLMTLDWRFASIFLAGGLMMLGVTFLLRKRMKILHKKVQESDGNLRSWMQESVESILVLKSFQAENLAANRTSEYAAKHRKVRMQRRTFSNVCNIGYSAVMQGGYLFGLMWCGFGILHGTLTFGTLTAVLQLINQVSSPFAYISGFVPQYYSMLASGERLIELEKLPKDIRAKKTLPEFKALHAKNLSFTYKNGVEEVISNATFEIKKGELVAITGISGVGKSTLLKMLLGIYHPCSGRLYAETGESNAANDMRSTELDKTEEINIDASTREWFSYVPQGNMLISGSIYEAVNFLNKPPYTQEQKKLVQQACMIACADEFIKDLPDGYNTILGEKGAGLSEGQLQRIAIARAIYHDAPVLLLDEATSALDEATEQRLLHNLKSLTNKTVLIVTHRPAALEICEKQLILESTQTS